MSDHFDEFSKSLVEKSVPRRQSLLWLCAAIAGALLAPFAAGLADEAEDPLDALLPRVANPPLPSDLINLPGDLRAVEVPGPANLDEFIKDPFAALALGKALFWDMQVGSDGIQACASCHFRAGADPRSKNQVHPGVESDFLGPNVQLDVFILPCAGLAEPGAREALDPATDISDVVSSQGVHYPGDQLDPDGFSIGSVNTRRVEPRNTPSVINAVFNHRQFWDGRAENVFNGVNHLGQRDPNARVFRASNPNNPVEVRVDLVNSSLASQAVAPIVSALEMSAPGRTVQDVGNDLAKTPRKIYKRIQYLRPLSKQQVHPSDSLLGPMSRWPNRGLTARTYDEMIKSAF